MNYQIVNGSVSYGAETILEEINFEIKGKQKVAIVGRNGCGKSTLLKAIINNELLSEGISTEKFNVYKEGCQNIGYLEQINFENDQNTMLEEILKEYQEIINIERKMEELVKEMQVDNSSNLGLEYTKLHDRYELLDGYTYKKEYQTMVYKFGFNKDDLDKKICKFSGGQRTKIAFIKLLLSKPDLLLLDEPTNHLDIVTIEWLESYLKNYSKAVVIVSHDRIFLNNIVDRVCEIEYGTITEYTGNYEDFERQKKINYEKQLKDYEFQQKEIKRLNTIADRFKYKPTKAKMALSKLKQIERMVKIEEPNKYDLKSFKTNFEINKESGKNVLNVENLEIGYNKTLAKVDFKLYKGQKLGIIGENGTGKSTLLKTLIGNINPISGKYEFGHNVEIGFFEQQMAMLNLDKTIFDDFYDEFPNLTTTQIRNSLAAFMFYGEDVFKKIEMLSGGEKVRYILCKILKKGPNVLILDEPTNHMDIVGKESLEELLKAYNGTIIFVSHDRFFVNKISNCILEFENNKATFYDNTYTEYLEKKEVLQKEQIVEEKQEKEKKKIYSNPLKERTKLERKIEKIEENISMNEEKIKELQNKMQDQEICSDYMKITELQEEVNKLLEENNGLMEEWAELEENLAEF